MGENNGASASVTLSSPPVDTLLSARYACCRFTANTSDASAPLRRAEGFDSRRAFLSLWRALHGDTALEARVWVLTFELVSPAIPENHPVEPFAYAYS